MVVREKNSTGSRRESGFISEGAIGKTGVPTNSILWGDCIVGLSYKPEVQ